MIIEQGQPQSTGDEPMPVHLRTHRDRQRLLPILAAALTIAVVVAFWLAQFRPAAPRHAPDLDANNGIATRDELKRADPKLAALLTEVFGDDPWRYVRPDRRTTPGDLAGLDRDTLPTFAWPAD